MANNKIYPTTCHSATELINHMYNFLTNAQGMDTQRIDNAEGGLTIPSMTITRKIELIKDTQSRFMWN